MLDALSELKPMLVDQYEKWRAAHPEGDTPVPASVPATATASTPASTSVSASTAAAVSAAASPIVAPPIRRSSTPHTPAPYTPNAQYIDPSTPRQPPQRSPRRNQYDDNRPSPHGIPPAVDEQEARKRSSAMDAARRAADPSQAAALANRETIMASVRRAADTTQPDLQSAFQRMRIDEDRKRDEEAKRLAEQRRLQDEQARRQQQELEELRRREESRRAREEQEIRRREEEEMLRREEDLRRRNEEERRKEKEFLLRRQQEAAEMAKTSRMASLYQQQPLLAPTINAPGPSRLSVSNSQDYYQSSDDEAFYPKPLPLQTPARYEDDTTDSESQEDSNSYHHHRAADRHVHDPPHRALLKPAYALSYPLLEKHTTNF
jgi:hypothetical protein